MNTSLKTTLVAGLLAVGSLTAVVAQTTTAPHSSASPTMNSSGTPAPALGANSQAAPPRTDSTSPAAVTTTAAPSRTTGAPVAGANSFTEGQARSRIEEKGFGNVADLKKDDKGVWRGTAMKDGKSVSVSLDYQGNIVTQ